MFLPDDLIIKKIVRKSMIKLHKNINHQSLQQKLIKKMFQDGVCSILIKKFNKKTFVIKDVS